MLAGAVHASRAETNVAETGALEVRAGTVLVIDQVVAAARALAGHAEGFAVVGGPALQPLDSVSGDLNGLNAPRVPNC